MRSRVATGAIGLVVWLASAAGAGAHPVFRVTVAGVELVGFDENSTNLEAISYTDHFTASFDMTPRELPAPERGFFRFEILRCFVGLSVSSVNLAAEAEKEEARLAELDGGTVTSAPMSNYAPKASRPAILPALYATLGAMQVWDLYSTNAAIKAGAREANPTTAAFTGNAGALIGLKAVTTASTIFFAERMWKKNRVGAIVVLVAVNGATAAISMHNMRNAKLSAARR